ncbi:MAG: aminotransferase, partial [Candidatus Aenigmarchaeota archaeon]|nr:aminotransferase [Candidatus Aenigmarchaeota archaeon]MDI6722906.1 aminotransferase [Candidatus Aenigmarchaeota archaeon]
MPTMFSRYVEAIENSWIRQMPVLASKVPDVVSLGQGIPSFELPDYIKDALSKALYEEPLINKYSLQPG